MELHFKDNVPIYLQIIVEIKRRIVAGEWPPGGRIPSVRELAQGFEVNPNTMQRALSELEREGLLYSERTSGRFVTEDKSRIEAARGHMAAEYIREFVGVMTELGYAKEGIVQQVSAMMEEEA